MTWQAKVILALACLVGTAFSLWLRAHDERIRKEAEAAKAAALRAAQLAELRRQLATITAGIEACWSVMAEQLVPAISEMVAMLARFSEVVVEAFTGPVSEMMDFLVSMAPGDAHHQPQVGDDEIAQWREIIDNARKSSPPS